MPKKSFYIFLTALLGVMLFLILHRSVVFFYLYLLAAGVITTDLSYYQFLAIDYFTLTLTLMFGGWYGIWLGMYWYEKVYGENSRGGFVDNLSRHLFLGRKDGKLEAQLAAAKERVEEDVWQLEDLADAAVAEVAAAKPARRKIVRKPAAKKVKRKVV